MSRFLIHSLLFIYSVVKQPPDPLADDLGGVDEVVEDSGVDGLQGPRPEDLFYSMLFI